MKKILSLLLAAAILVCLAGCGNNSVGAKERKRAAKGQNTVTAEVSKQEEVTLDTGLLNPLDKTYAKSNKAGIVYDPNIFIDILDRTADTVKIACVGDSITYGSISDNPKTDSYHVQLGKLLSKRYGDRFEVTNYGHAGAYIADFGRSNASTLRYCNTKEYSALRKDKPDVVIIMLGINDIGYITDGKACEELKNSYRKLISDIKALKSNPLVFVCTPLVRVTAYSSYLAQTALNNAVISAADSAGAYVIDTYSITKEYFEGALYETDGLHPNNAGYKYLAQTVMNAVADGLTSYKEGTLEPTEKYVVYVDSSKGSYDSVGASPDKPTSNLARAVDLCRGGGTIVVSGPITPATTGLNIVKVFIAPENDYKITVTSIDPYNGTDYRKTNNARIFMSGSMYLNGDFEFKNVTFDYIASSTKIVCGYNNITFASGVSCTVSSGGYSVIIYGHDVVSKWQTEEALSCNRSCSLTVNSGTFTYLRGGNYRAVSDEESPYPYGTIKSGVTVSITVNGGTFAREEGASNFGTAEGTLSSAVGQNGMQKGSTVNLTVSGGTFKGAFFAVPRLNPYPASGAPEIAGTVNITVNSGVISGSGIDYLQSYPGAKKPKLTGAYNLTLNGGTFAGSSAKSFSASGCPNSVLKLSADCAYLENWATISGFETVNK